MHKRLTSRTLPSPSGRPNMLTLLPISHLLHCYTVTCCNVALLHASASAGHIPPLTRLLHSHCYKLVSSTHTYPVQCLNIYRVELFILSTSVKEDVQYRWSEVHFQRSSGYKLRGNICRKNVVGLVLWDNRQFPRPQA